MLQKISRRNFLYSGIAGGAGFALKKPASLLTGRQEKPKIRQYRVLGRTKMRVSDISLGTGTAPDPALINYLLDQGVNYIDTAEHYASGQSETVIGQIAKRRRKDFFITTKLHLFPNSTEANLRDRFLQCLERLQVDYVDTLMIHNVRRRKDMNHVGFNRAFQSLRGDGKVNFLGISTHEPNMIDLCNYALEDGKFDLLLFVYNFMQKKSENILLKAKYKDVGTTLMKVHASEHPEQINSVTPEQQQTLQDEADRQTVLFREKYKLTEKEYFKAAIKWVLNNKRAGTVVSTIRNFDQADDYLAASGEPFTRNDQDTLDSYSLRIQNKYCRHACGECESLCPYGVAVNDVLRIDSYFTNYRQEKKALVNYAGLDDSRKPLRCAECDGRCETGCRFGLSVRGRLMSAHERLTFV